jgi:hypothetical protein
MHSVFEKYTNAPQRIWVVGQSLEMNLTIFTVSWNTQDD